MSWNGEGLDARNVDAENAKRLAQLPGQRHPCQLDRAGSWKPSSHTEVWALPWGKTRGWMFGSWRQHSILQWVEKPAEWVWFPLGMQSLSKDAKVLLQISGFI